VSAAADRMKANTDTGCVPLRVGVLTTHPIQYQVPWFRALAREPGIDLHVFFAMLPDAAQQGDGFGVGFEWDVPLIDGYPSRVLKNVARMPSVTRFDGCDTPEISGIVRAGGWDAFIVNGWVAKSCLQLLLACRRYGVPCVVRGEANGLRPRAGWKRFGHRLLLRQYAACLAIGKNNRAYYLQSGVDAARIFDTPYCVDNDRFARAVAALLQDSGPGRVRERFGLEPDAPAFVFSGKFADKKRPADFVEAVRIATSHGVRLQGLLVGAGPLERELRERARGLPMRFAGFLNQSEMPAAYAASDVIVLPSDHGETWGLVVNEAMACGRPAIVSDQVGCAADLVTPGTTGDIYPCGDVHALARSLCVYATDVRRIGDHGAAARDRVLNCYNYERVIAGIRAALAAVGRISSAA
jgi:glycosyltransferase involved in cell wall biosynthesis